MHCISLRCSTHCIACLVYEGACGCGLAVQPDTAEKHTKHLQALTGAHHPDTKQMQTTVAVSTPLMCQPDINGIQMALGCSLQHPQAPTRLT